MTARVCLLKEPSQVRSLMSAAGDVLSHSRLVSLDLDVSAALEDFGLPYETLWDHVDAAGCREIEKKAHWLQDNWFRIGEPCLPQWLEEVASLDRVRSSLLFRDALFAERLFARAVGRDTQEVCICSPLDRAAVCEKTNDVPEAVWAYLAERSGLSVRRLPFHPYSPPARAQEPPGKTGGLLALPGMAVRGLRNVMRPRRLGKRPVIFYIAGSQRRYAGICRALSTIFGDDFVPLTNGKGPLTVEGVTYRGIRSVVGRPSRRWRGGEFRPAELPVAEDYPYIFRNAHLHFHFEHYTKRRWPRVGSMLEKLDRFFRKVNPRCVLCEDLAYSYESAMCAAARKLGIPSVTLPHSGIASVLGVHQHADVALVWTEEYRKGLATEGMPGDRIHVIGMPYDMVYGAYPSRDTAPGPQGEGRKHRLLVLSAGVESGALPYGDMSKYPVVVKRLLDVPAELTDRVEVCWKCHPDCDHYDYYTLVARETKGAGVRITRDESLEKLVHEADVVVIPDTPTSAYLGALYADKPIVLVRFGEPGHYLSQPASGRSCAVVEKAADIWLTIQRALFETDFREGLVERARACHGGGGSGSGLLSAEAVARKISDVIRQESGNAAHVRSGCQAGPSRDSRDHPEQAEDRRPPPAPPPGQG